MGLDVTFYADGEEVAYMRKPYHLVIIAAAMTKWQFSDSFKENYQTAKQNIGTATGKLEVTRDKWGAIIEKAIETEKEIWTADWCFDDSKKPERREEYLGIANKLLQYDNIKIEMVS